MIRYANTPMDYEFLGPIAVALKRFVQTQGLNPFIARLIGDRPLIEVWPEMKERINADILYDTYHEADGAPTNVDFDPQTLAMLRQKKQQEMEQQKKLAMAKEAAGAYKQTTEAPQDGSPAQQSMDQGGGQ
jgi:hypothetical protein